jgi:3-methyladenine DNA glycosylase/8-oxoguanine DNA glycosylase
MPNPELRDWLNQTTLVTQAGTIKWRIANPTTYTWDIPAPKNGRVILQRVERVEAYQEAPGRMAQRKIVNYIMQVFDLHKPQTPVIQFNGADDPEANTQLEKLFEIVSSEVMRENLIFLNSLLPSEPGTGNPQSNK